MHKKLTITIEENVYKALHAVVGRTKISQFIEALVKPHVMNNELDAAYKQMAEDEAREEAALELANGTYQDAFDEKR
jgi:predicted CopG family antitoxin